MLFSWLSSLEEKQHRNSAENTEGLTLQTGVWLHCSIGPPLEPGEIDETKVQVSPVYRAQVYVLIDMTESPIEAAQRV